MQASGKLQIGYYAQHQTEELSKNLTAFQQMQLVMKEAGETQIRAHLGAFGLTQQKADTRIEQLSGRHDPQRAAYPAAGRTDEPSGH